MPASNQRFSFLHAVRYSPSCQLFLVLAAVSFFFVSFAGSSQSADQRQPELNVSESIRDLGILDRRQRWIVDFQVRNTGHRRLVINQVDVDCGCGIKILRTFVVPVGESKDLPVSLDSRFADGKIETIASYRSNDPDRPKFNLIARGRIDRSTPSDLSPTLADTMKPESELDTQSKSVSVLIRQ